MGDTPRPAERPGTTDLPPDERELHAVWDAYHARAVFDRAIAKADSPRAAEVLRYGRDRELDVSAIDALRANRQLVDLLVGRRWYVMMAAREAGVSWAEIAEAVGYEGELDAMEEYRESIERQAKYVGDLHDAARAEAALADGPRVTAPVEIVAAAGEPSGEARNCEVCYRPLWFDPFLGRFTCRACDKQRSAAEAKKRAEWDRHVAGEMERQREDQS